MRIFLYQHKYFKNSLILLLCLTFVFLNTFSSSSLAEDNNCKSRSLTLGALIAVTVIIGGAISGVKYAAQHIYQQDWMVTGQVAAIAAGMASGLLSCFLIMFGPAAVWASGLLSCFLIMFGPAAVCSAYAATEPAIEELFSELFETITEEVVTIADDPNLYRSINNIQDKLNSVAPSIEEFILQEYVKIADSSGQQGREWLYSTSFWADFSYSVITHSNMDVSTNGMEYNDYYGGSWRMLTPGASRLDCTFSIIELPEQEALEIVHLTSASSNVPSGGYAPVDIYINGQLFLDNYDVAEAHDGSHSFEHDCWDIASYLQTGENNIHILFEDDPLAETHYWIQALAIRPVSFNVDPNASVLTITPSGSDPSTTVKSTWSVFGNITDGNGNNVAGASVNVFLSGYSQSWGSGTTDSNGNYSINNIPAPSNDGSYTITIEASASGITGSNSSQTLTVNDPKEGHDLALGGFEVDPMSITPGGALTLNALGITNKGEYPEEFDLIFELKYPNGNLCASKSKHLSLEEGHSLGLQSETLSSNLGVSGNYTAVVRIDCLYDINPEDNQRSLSVYVGQIQNYTQYKGDYIDCYPDDPVMVYGDYKLNVLYMGTYFRADVLKNNNVIASSVRFDSGVPHYFDGNQLLVFCDMSDVQYVSAFMGTPNTVPFTYTPSTPHFSQGTTGILKVECPTSSRFQYFYDGDIILTDDVSTVRDWYDRETFINDWEVNRKFNIPASQATGTYTVWFSESLVGGDYVYLKMLDFVIEKGHDAFVNSISTKVGGVEKIEFDIGEDVTITANVGVSGGYTEEVNVVLSITGPNDYYYPDSKDRIESKATIGSTSQDIAFDPWNTSGLIPGNYTISVTANMGADINSGNNSKTKAVVIKELPALIVNGQTDKTSYDQGEQIELTATVTDPNTNPVDDATVTATITWPDLTESNPALSYNTMSDKYEYNFNVVQFGDYTIELRAVKTNYGTGSKELPAVTVNNTPPDTTINNVVPSEGQAINSNSVTFSWTGSDSGTPVHHLAYSWKLDEGSYSDFSTNTIIELNGLSDGPHTFYVKAFDGVLEDLTPAQRSFIVDTSEPPEVYLSKTANKTTVTSGEVVTYTITYDNDGAGPAKNAVIEDVIPANTTYVGGSASSSNAIHTGNVVVEVKVNSVWESDSVSPSGEVTEVRWTFDSDIAVDDGDNYGTVEDESPNTNDTDAGTVTLQATIE